MAEVIHKGRPLNEQDKLYAKLDGKHSAMRDISMFLSFEKHFPGPAVRKVMGGPLLSKLHGKVSNEVQIAFNAQYTKWTKEFNEYLHDPKASEDHMKQYEYGDFSIEKIREIKQTASKKAKS